MKAYCEYLIRLIERIHRIRLLSELLHDICGDFDLSMLTCHFIYIATPQSLICILWMVYFP